MYLFFLSVKIINPFSEYLTAGYSIFALLVVDFIIMYSEVITGVQLGGNEFANGKARHGCWLEMDVDEDVDGDVDKDVGMRMGNGHDDADDEDYEDDDGECDPRWNGFLMCSMRR